MRNRICRQSDLNGPDLIKSFLNRSRRQVVLLHFGCSRQIFSAFLPPPRRRRRKRERAFLRQTKKRDVVFVVFVVFVLEEKSGK